MCPVTEDRLVNGEELQAKEYVQKYIKTFVIL